MLYLILVSLEFRQFITTILLHRRVGSRNLGKHRLLLLLRVLLNDYILILMHYFLNPILLLLQIITILKNLILFHKLLIFVSILDIFDRFGLSNSDFNFLNLFL